MGLEQDFGKRLAELREANCLTQEEFADMIGIHRNSYVKIEKGDGFTSADTLEKIQKVLQIPYSELFNFEQKPEKDLKKALLIKLQNLNDSDLEYFLTSIKAYKKAQKNR